MLEGLAKRKIPLLVVCTRHHPPVPATLAWYCKSLWQAISAERFKQSWSTRPGQLPWFNITLLFQPELARRPAGFHHLP